MSAQGVQHKDFVPAPAEADIPEGHIFMPLFDRLLVDEDRPDMVTPGGLILPDGFQRPRPGRGTVVALGPGRPDNMGNWIKVPDGITIGTLVLFNQHAGVEITLNEKVMLMLNAGDLLGFVADTSQWKALNMLGDSAGQPLETTTAA